MLLKLADSPPAAVGALPSVSPVPEVQVLSQPAPGKKGPTGIAPRTNYSRVNPVSPPAPDAGAVEQKSLQPKYGSTMHDVTGRPTLQDLVHASMEGAVSRIKLAEEGKRQQENHDGKSDEKCEKCDKDPCTCSKTASAAPGNVAVSTKYAHTVANALEFLSKHHSEAAAEEKTAAETQGGPGKGPGTLAVTEATASGKIPEHKGQATPAGVVPMHPAEEKGKPNDHSATAMATNAATPPGGGGKTPEKIAEADLEKKNLERIKEAFNLAAGGRVGGMGGSGGLSAMRPAARAPATGMGLTAPFQHAGGMGMQSIPGVPAAIAGPAAAGAAASPKPSAAVDPAAAAAMMQQGTLRGALGGMGNKLRGAWSSLTGGAPGAAPGMVPKFAESPEGQLAFKNMTLLAKLAEDAINPAKISAGAAVPPQASASGQAGGQPAGGAPKGPTQGISSNQAAIDLTRREAYKNRISDMSKWLTQPMDSAKHDSTLQVTLDHTREAGPKIASANVKTAAAQAVLKNLVEKVALGGMKMEKLSESKQAEVLADAAAVIRTVCEERDTALAKVAEYEQNARVTKLAAKMKEKGITGEDDSTLVENLNKAASEGRLDKMEEAVDLVGPDMWNKLASKSDDSRTTGGSAGSSDLERYLSGAGT